MFNLKLVIVCHCMQILYFSLLTHVQLFNLHSHAVNMDFDSFKLQSVMFL